MTEADRKLLLDTLTAEYERRGFAARMEAIATRAQDPKLGVPQKQHELAVATQARRIAELEAQAVNCELAIEALAEQAEKVL
jgi:hypothetical protein